MGFESRAISARVTKQIVTIFSKICDKDCYLLALYKEMLFPFLLYPSHPLPPAVSCKFHLVQRVHVYKKTLHTYSAGFGSSILNSIYCY